MKTVLISGASGMLGEAFCNHFTSSAREINILKMAKADFSLTKQDLIKKFSKYNISHIIHCAALTDADFCEKNPKLAKLVSEKCNEAILTLGKINCAQVVLPQSFLIYDGKINPVDETTPPNPISIYGKIKLETEEFFKNNTDKFLIVRMGGFFGGYEKDENFVGKFIKIIKTEIIRGKKEIVFIVFI